MDEGVSKDWQYFANLRHNLAPLDAFVKFVEAINHASDFKTQKNWSKARCVGAPPTMALLTTAGIDLFMWYAHHN